VTVPRLLVLPGVLTLCLAAACSGGTSPRVNGGATVSPSATSSKGRSLVWAAGREFTSAQPGARFGDGSSSDIPNAVIAAGTSFVAVGGTGTKTKTLSCSGNAAAWSSADGTTWNLDSAGSLDATSCTGLSTAVAAPSQGNSFSVLAGGSGTPPGAGSSYSPFIATGQGGSWSAASTPPAGASASVESLLHAANGYVAFGTTKAGGAVAWTSSDGNAWSTPRDIPGDHGFKIEGAASHGNDIIVVASYDVQNDTDPLTSAFWRSGDGGLMWTYSRVKGRVGYGIVATSHGFAMAGIQGANYKAPSPGMWLSNDGSSWRPVTSESLGSRGYATAIAGEGDDLLAIGVKFSDGSDRALAQTLAWSSADGGETWSSAPPPPPLPPLDSVQYGAHITHLAIAGDRVVALGEGQAAGADGVPRITYSASWLAN
jgi:hypothetical protein